MPLGRSSDQGGEPWFERFSGLGIQPPVGSTKLESTIITLGDMPAVFVNKPVMKPTEKYQIVQVGGPGLRPVDDVVGLKHFVVATSRVLTLSAVPVDHKSSQPSGNGPIVPTDTDDDSGLATPGPRGLLLARHFGHSSAPLRGLVGITLDLDEL